MKVKKLVKGIGINDADYVVQPTINGKQIMCPFYKVWVNMIFRCYSEKMLARHPTYAGCSVCDDWLTFSKFKLWMEGQDWSGKELDKDILIPGNKIYGPDYCVFVDSSTNNFVIDCRAARGEWPIGVSFRKDLGMFVAACCNPITKKQKNLGYFNCPNQAHAAWKREKHRLALLVADLQTNDLVASALRLRYA